VLPTAIPLTSRWNAAELRSHQATVYNAAHGAAGMWDQGTLEPGAQQIFSVDHLQVQSPEGLVSHQEGRDLPADFAQGACADPDVAHPLHQEGTKEQWVVACVEHDGHRIIAATVPSYTGEGQMLYLVFALSAIVGIITALGVLRLLSPLSRVSKALDRVSAGERGVRLKATGLAELDDLVDRLNNAARAMEERENAVMERIQLVQEMARLVAHEVRNPLQSLELLTSLIASEDDPEDRHEIARSIHSEIRGLDMVVNRLLREGAAGGGGLRLIRLEQSLAPLVTQVVALRKTEADAHGIRLELGSMSDQLAPVDAALLGRSIQNLVLNAMQYAPPRSGVVRVSVEEQNRYLCIVVEDNGPGVDPDLAAHIFEAPISGRTGGTGLGLTLAKGVVDAHRGYIEHGRSELGGARFVVCIPKDEEDDGTEAASSAGR